MEFSESDQDSDFYGTIPTISKFRSLAQQQQQVDPAALWAAHQRRLLTQPSAAGAGSAHDTCTRPDVCSRQPGEQLDAFLTRLSPTTTDPDEHAFIWTCAPGTGAEPVAMPTPDDVSSLVREGGELLASLRGVAVGKAARARREVVARLQAVAWHLGVRGGKWMLFPSARDVGRVWSLIARATADGRLGVLAKVATHGREAGHDTRLVCVYTEDFRNEQDVERVLGELRRLRLHLVTGVKEKYLRYKPDVYSFLNIHTRNEDKIVPHIVSISVRRIPRRGMV